MVSGDGVVEVVESGGREPCCCQCVKALGLFTVAIFGPFLAHFDPIFKSHF